MGEGHLREIYTCGLWASASYDEELTTFSTLHQTLCQSVDRFIDQSIDGPKSVNQS